MFNSNVARLATKGSLPIGVNKSEAMESAIKFRNSVVWKGTSKEGKEDTVQRLDMEAAAEVSENESDRASSTSSSSKLDQSELEYNLLLMIWN